MKQAKTSSPYSYARPICWTLYAKTPEEFLALADEVLLNVSPNGEGGSSQGCRGTCAMSLAGSVTTEQPTSKRQGKHGKRVHWEAYRKVANRVLLDLYTAWAYDSTLYLGYSRRAKSYSRVSLPRFVSYRRVKAVADALSQMGWIDTVPGYPDLKSPGTGGRQSLMRASATLQRTFAALSDPDVKHELAEDFELIRLRDADGNDMPCPKYPELPAMLVKLRLINRQLASSQIAFDNPDIVVQLKQRLRAKGDPVNLAQTQLYRVFNVDFEHGGRFYGGWWQNTPKEFRQHITIDSSPTVELDYSTLHLSMIYAREGLAVPPGDLYDIGRDSQYRDMVKALTNALLNAQTEDAAMAALCDFREAKNRELWEPFTDLAPVKQHGKYEGLLRPMLNMIKGKHAAVAVYFGSGAGAELQTRDARLAELVMEYGAWQSITVLPVHDSFIVKATQEAEFDQIMRQTFHAVFVQNIGVKAKGINAKGINA